MDPGPVAFEAEAREVGYLGFSFYPRSKSMHIDLGRARQWRKRVPVQAMAFAEETPPTREILADSCTMNGGGAVGAATLGAAGVEVAQQVLAEAQSAVLPLVPCLNTLRWVFIAAPPNGSSVWVRVVDEVSGAVFEQEITADLPANTQFLSPRLFMNNGATAAAVAYDCSGVYVETDY